MFIIHITADNNHTDRQSQSRPFNDNHLLCCGKGRLSCVLCLFWFPVEDGRLGNTAMSKKSPASNPTLSRLLLSSGPILDDIFPSWNRNDENQTILMQEQTNRSDAILQVAVPFVNKNQIEKQNRPTLLRNWHNISDQSTNFTQSGVAPSVYLNFLIGKRRIIIFIIVVSWR